MIRLFSIFILLFAAAAVPAADKTRAADMENSVVQIEVSRRQYDFVQPWTRRVDQLQKVGTIVGPPERWEHVGEVGKPERGIHQAQASDRFLGLANPPGHGLARRHHAHGARVVRLVA